MTALCPIEITQKLIQFPSITPQDAGCMEYIQTLLSKFGFTCHIESIHGVQNFYARLGTQAPHFCFLGHTDVVPTGHEASWKHPPFGGIIEDDQLFGRGASDMKGAIGAFITAVSSFLSTQQDFGSMSILLTSDEEGPALHGVRAMIPWLQEHGEHIDACLVGEPTNPERMGEMVKIGRRGSMNGHLTITGKAGHVAYPERAVNPVPVMVDIAQKLNQIPLDQGDARFQPSHLEITSIDVGNPTTNVIPSQAILKFNIRFNPHFTGAQLETYVREYLTAAFLMHEHNYQSWHLDLSVSGEAFITQNEQLQIQLTQAIEEISGSTPSMSTSGGTSDARFIKDLCPVIEYGLTSNQAHQTNEYAFVQDIKTLTQTYQRFLELFFQTYTQSD